MPIFDNDRRFQFSSAPTLVLIGAALLTACVADEPGLEGPAAAGAGVSGSQNKAGAAGKTAIGGTQMDEPGAGAGGAAFGGSSAGGTLSVAGGEQTGGTE